VGEIVDRLGMESPRSRSIAGIARVGFVNVRRDGRRMLYRTNAEAIRPLHEWTETFERYWRHQLSRVRNAPSEKAIRPNNSGRISFQGGKMISTAQELRI